MAAAVRRAVAAAAEVAEDVRLEKKKTPADRCRGFFPSVCYFFGFTSFEMLLVPPASVTLSTTVYAPCLANTCVGLGPLPFAVPSPQFHE